jgi:hypothetical protein
VTEETTDALRTLSWLVLLGSVAAAAYWWFGAVLGASTGVLSGGWNRVYVEIGGILACGTPAAIFLFWTRRGVRRPPGGPS